MTAEIAIMNKEAVALAADSAVTIGRGKKIFTSANKLFTLSKYYPVGIMVYGDALFMQVPWETIIKIYREKLSNRKFETLRAYASDFLAFLDKDNPLFPGTIQDEYVHGAIYAYFNFIKRSILEKIHQIIDERGEITESSIERITSRILDEQYQIWGKSPNIGSIPENLTKGISEKYGDFIDKALRLVLEKLPISQKRIIHLKEIAAWLFSKFPSGIDYEGISGVVFAGFGEAETFPSLYSFDIEGVALGKLKYREREGIPGKIDFQNNAVIIPFAQSEMVTTFMEGVDPSLEIYMQAYLTEVFDEFPAIIADSLEKLDEGEKRLLKGKLKKLSRAKFKDYQKNVTAFRRENYVNPVIDVVAVLPKDELAAMAESLVNLTSFKRKVSMESETVAGPIDVAIISKGDGFVWIKRKHYFKPELNPHFFANYYKELRRESKEEEKSIPLDKRV